MTLCDWCRRRLPVDPADAAGEDIEAHLAVCPEHTAWALHPEAETLREYWVRIGDGQTLHLTRVLGRPVRITRRMRFERGPWDHWRWPNWMTRNEGDVIILVLNRDRQGHSESAWDVAGELNRGQVYNNLEVARASLRRTATWWRGVADGIAERAAGDPIRRKYTKATEALRLPMGDAA